MDVFIVKELFLLFAGTFFICLFVYLMAFLFQKVDSLIGKGLDLVTMGKFFYYSALTMIPMSLPLAILLASLIGFGNLGERFELTAIKAAGVSLIRVMIPLIVFMAMLAGISFYFQNVVGPQSTVKLYTLLFSIQQKSPELDIPEGVFYSQIPGYNVYVERKDPKSGYLHNVMIYNFSKGFDNAVIVLADSARLDMTAEKAHLLLQMHQGEQFENLTSQDVSMGASSIPYRRETFVKKTMLIDFDVNLNMMDNSAVSQNARAKDMKAINHSIDSLKSQSDSLSHNFYEQSKATYFKTPDATPPAGRQPRVKQADFEADFNRLSPADQKNVLQNAEAQVSMAKNNLEFNGYVLSDTQKNIREHEIEWWRKVTLSLSCIVFFFVGAPLGAIIRKGGLGLPVIISVIIFLIYFILDTTGTKLGKDGTWEPWLGMWLSTIVLAPLGIFLTYKANNDSVLFNMEMYTGFFRKLLGIRTSRHIFAKDVIINDPDYRKDYGELQTLSEMCGDYMKRARLTRLPNYFKLFGRSNSADKQVEDISRKLEGLVEELNNSRNRRILLELEEYPILWVRAHTTPFKRRWLNILAGVCLPVGLVLYLRIWRFRLRLAKDLRDIIRTDERLRRHIQTMLEKE